MPTRKNRISPDEILLFFLLLFGPLAHGTVETWSITTAHLILICLISIAVLTQVYKGQLKCYRTPVDLPIVLFLLAILLSYFTSVTPYTSRTVIYKLLAAVALFFYIIHTQRSREKINLLLWMIVILGTVYAVMGLTIIKGDILGFKIFSGRHYNISLFYVNYNHFAGYLELVFCLSVGLTAANKGGKRILLFGMTILIALALLFTLSRGGILGASGGLAFFMITSAIIHRKKKGYILFLSAMSLGLIIITWFGLNPVLERLSTLDNLSVAGKARIQIWQDALAMIYDRPFSGWGPGTFSVAFPAYQTDQFNHQFVNYAHNDYLELTTDTGILGLAIFISGLFWLYISCLKKITKTQSNYLPNIGIGSLAACFSILIHSATDCNLQIQANLFLFVIAAGIAVIAADNSRKKRNTPALRANISLDSLTKKRILFVGTCLIFCASAAIASLPFLCEQALTAAKISFRQGKYDDAIFQIDQALFFNPDYAEFLSLKGDILLTKRSQTDRLSDIKSCTGCKNIIFWYKKASKAAPTNSSYLRKQGAFFERYQKIAKAKKAYKEAIQLSPMYAPPYYRLAILYLRQQQTDDALNSFRQYLKCAGTTKVPQVLDDIWSAGGEYEMQKRAIPETASFRQAFANYLTRNGKKELAEQENAFAFRQDPTARNARVHLNLLWRNKNFSGSIKMSKAYLHQFPEDIWIKERYAVSLEKVKQYEQAILIYQQLTATFTDNPKKAAKYFIKIARLYAQQKLYSKAVAALHQGIEKYPRTGILFYHTGLYLRKMKKNGDALHALKKAGSLMPSNVWVRYQLGEEYRRNRLEQEALNEWKECLAIKPTFARCKTGIKQIQKEFGLPVSGQ
ncbi:O-antigen ligase family protein [Desulfobulbus sp. TB]|nr:O-antigen ligase family protein [Desulfobulbus sp. TB]